MINQEDRIVYESTSGIWVEKEFVNKKMIFTVRVNGSTSSVDDKSLAITRAKYLTQHRPTREDVLALYDNIMKFNRMQTGK